MARFPLFSTAQKGRSPRVSSQRRVNLYGDFRQDGDRNNLVFYNTAGLTLFANLGDEPIRGARALSETLYCVHRGTFYSIDNAGTATSQGSLDTSSGRVGIADDGNVIVIVDGDNGYTYTIASDTFAKITDGDFPGADTVDYQSGYFVVNKPDTGQFFISENGTDWDALDFASAESFPDDLVSVWVDRGQVVLFGGKSTEFWGNVGTTDFPYQRVSGAVVEYGLAARWSLAKAGNTTIFLGKNRTGEVEPIMLDGYTPVPIGNSDVEYLINNYASVSDATALAYRYAGHTFYQLNFPSAGKSWLYDLNTRLWSELEYGIKERHRAEIGVEYLERIVVTDYQNGRLYRLDADTYTDNGQLVARELVGRHIFNEEYVSVSRLWVDMETGGGGDTHQAMLSISKDGGRTWGTEFWRDIGAIGEYGKRAVWWTLGAAYEWTFRVRFTEDAQIAITGAWVDA